MWEILPENHRAGTVTHTVGWPLDLMSYGGPGHSLRSTESTLQTSSNCVKVMPKFHQVKRELRLETEM